MEIKVNGNSYSVKEGLLLSELFEEINTIQKRGVAIAINNSVVPSRKWLDTEICDGDSIIIIEATKGG